MKFLWSILLSFAVFMPLAAKDASFAFGRNVSWQKCELRGQFSVSKDNVLSLDGKTAEADVASELLDNPEKGITLMAVVKFKNLPDLTAEEKSHESIFFRRRQFVMSIYHGSRIYINFHNGKKWSADITMPVKYNDNKFHSYVMTAQKNKAKDSFDVNVYFDGKLVIKKSFPRFSVANSAAHLNIGHANGFGDIWHLGGEFLDARGYNRVLSEAEIKKYAASVK